MQTRVKIIVLLACSFIGYIAAAQDLGRRILVRTNSAHCTIELVRTDEKLPTSPATNQSSVSAVISRYTSSPEVADRGTKGWVPWPAKLDDLRNNGSPVGTLDVLTASATSKPSGFEVVSRHTISLEIADKANAHWVPWSVKLGDFQIGGYPLSPSVVLDTAVDNDTVLVLYKNNSHLCLTKVDVSPAVVAKRESKTTTEVICQEMEALGITFEAAKIVLNGKAGVCVFLRTGNETGFLLRKTDEKWSSQRVAK